MTQQIHACSDVHLCVAVHLLTTLMLTLTTSMHMSTSSTHIRTIAHVGELEYTVMEGVSEGGLDSVGDWIHIPVSKQQELQQQYPVVAQLKQAYSAYFLTHHPAPCLRIIATALYNGGELEALEVVQKLYLRGEPCTDSCRSEGRIDSLCIIRLQYTILSTKHCLLFVCVHYNILPLCKINHMSVHVCGLVVMDNYLY